MFSILLIISVVLAACAKATPPTTPTAVPSTLPPRLTAVPTSVPPTYTPTPTAIPTSVPPTLTSTPTAAPTATPTESLNPSPRAYTSMAYDVESDRVILFGGQKGDYRFAYNYNDETWAYDVTANKWTQMKPPSGPTRRSAATLTYDAESDRVILYGGGIPSNNWGLADTWAYDFNTNIWKQMANGPANHLGDRLAYDAESDRIILFGGYDMAGFYVNDTWAYDFNSDTWSEMKPRTSPPGRNYHAMAYDARADRVLVWGSDSDTPVDNSIWSYNFNTNTWQEKKPGAGAHPVSRDYPVMAYDTESDRMILYGGFPLGDETWAYAYKTNTWTKLEPNTVPGKLSRHAIVYSTAADRVIVFGGQVGSTQGKYSGETWAYDYNTNTWTNVTPIPTPIPFPNSYMGLVQVGAYKLPLFCEGKGEPTIILENGLDFPTWDVSSLSRFKTITRTCRYMRAGLNGETASGPRTTMDQVNDLHSLLTQAGVPGPYILVGHSKAGFILTLYTNQFPEDIVGLVCVDCLYASFEPIFMKKLAAQNPMSDAMVNTMNGEKIFETDWSQWNEKLDILTSEQQVLKVTSLGGRPFIVLVAGAHGDVYGDEKVNQLAEEAWMEASQELYKLSTHGSLEVVPNVDHWSIRLSNMVDAAIKEIYTAVTTGQ